MLIQFAVLLLIETVLCALDWPECCIRDRKVRINVTRCSNIRSKYIWQWQILISHRRIKTRRLFENMNFWSLTVTMDWATSQIKSSEGRTGHAVKSRGKLDGGKEIETRGLAEVINRERLKVS